ncbi:type II toxin-antitoxin system HicA family toxin [Clostridium beijerinckii]|uniref:YcfA-like protein n=1 Tax=Clostridium beijerinckii TaxID=1520 RepID=A0A1S8SA42_CLOBE|nr:type II toxin-antitoxin system HicA family toxin [Clostridium beijerinckii]NRY59870.1 putative RNA binding protein YcfA (HicA-like mRNA interferase family) [Clostridium beijerinckii]OOM62224.1 YcfA-like protein [Clostridium beijerinckii]
MNREKINQLIAELKKDTNWIERFNQLDKEYTDKVIDIIANHELYRYEVLDKLYQGAYILKSEIDSADIENMTADELTTKIGEWLKINAEQGKQYGKLMKDIYNHFKKSGTKIQSFYDEVEDRMTAYIDRNTNFDKFYKRIHTLSQKFIHMAVGLQMNMLGHDGTIVKTFEQLIELKEIAKKKIANETDEQVTELLKNFKSKHKDRKYKKIFDYKDMIKEAQSNGYEKYRQGATDHIILKHPNSNKCVTIPAKKLKFGLMMQIQKQIQDNKVA